MARQDTYSVFEQARCLVKRNYTFANFAQKLIKNKKFRREVLLSLNRLRASFSERGLFDVVSKIDNLKVDMITLLDETDPLEEKQTQEPVQSYLNECPVLLRRNRTANLSYYDNQRSKYYCDKYYFGSYGGFRE